MMQALLIGLIATLSQVCSEPPVITLNGYSPLILRCNQPYIELGAKANSICDGNLDHRVIVDNSSVNTTVPGLYTVTYTVSDLSTPPLTTTKTRTVDVRSDFVFEPLGYVTTIPYQDNPYFYDPEYDDYIDEVYITLWECKQPYDDPGAYAFDDCEGDMTSQITVLGADHVLTGDANTAYPVLYYIENPPRSTEDAVFRLRVVFIRDTIRPTISLYGTGYAYGNPQPSNFSPPTDWWWDACKSRYLAKYPVKQWNAATDLPGFLDVKEEWAAETMKWHCNKASYEDPGVFVIDSCDGYLEPNEVVIALTHYNSKRNREEFVYVARVGDPQGTLPDPDPLPGLWMHPDYHGFRVYYFMRDGSGNLAFRQTRLVEPLYGIAIIGVGGTTVVNCGDSFSPMEGVTALDLCEGNITSRVVVTGAVDTTRPGTYELLYRAQNNYGTFAEATRRIDVVDVTPPQIILLNELGVPTQDPNVFVPWCVWRARDDGELYGTAWWNAQYWMRPYLGWIVQDQCDDNDRLTLAVQQTGRTAIREALEFLQAPRDQGVDPAPYLKTYAVWHDVTDKNGNKAMPVPRLVTIVPSRPEITLVDNLTLISECGIPYVDQGIESIRDVLDVIGGDPCDSDVPGYFNLYYKVVPPGVDPESVSYAVYIPGTTVITIDEHLLGPHQIYYRAVNPLNFDHVVIRTVRVEDNAAPTITYNFVNYFAFDNGIYKFDCLNVLEADISEYLTFSASDSCDGAISGNVEHELVREMLPNGTWIYSVILTVVDSAGNVSETETARFVSISEDPPSLILGGIPGAAYEGAFLLHECATLFGERDNLVAQDGCGYPLNLLDAPPEPGLPGVWVWAWALDATGKPLWRDTGAGLEPMAYSYSTFSNIRGDYLLLYIAFDLWGLSYPELDDVTGLPNILDANGNLTIRDGSGNLTVDYARLVRIKDRMRPVITLLGDDIVEIECGFDYHDAGATALDLCQGDLTGAIIVGGDTVNTSRLGTYIITYNVSDSAGNAAVRRTRRVDVVDSTAPIVILLGLPEIRIECGAGEYQEPGALASDVCGGGAPLAVVIGGDAVDVATVGSYTVTYTATDAEGNSRTAERVIIVEDTVRPLLTLLGEAVLTVECGSVYEDPGFLAEDACAGDLTGAVVVTGDTVDTFRFGEYTVIYTVVDGSGNTTERPRRIYVIDTTPPVITLPGSNPVTVPWGQPYSEPAGYSAIDACDGNLTSEMSIMDEVNTNRVGTYTVTYAVEDSSGNVAEEVRTVYVVDPSAATITLLGPSEVTFECGTPFPDPGATAVDMIDGDISFRIMVIAPPGMEYEPGVYTVIYRVVNSRNSESVVERTITVIDTTAPIITLRGPAAVNIDCESVLFILDEYAIAIDSCDSRPIVTRDGDVDTGTPGAYTVLYTAEDSEGNTAQAILVVTVRNNCPATVEGEPEGEPEGEEGEGEDEECTGCRACLGCCPDEDGKWLPKNWLGDWLLIGLSMLVLTAYGTSRRL